MVDLSNEITPKRIKGSTASNNILEIDYNYNHDKILESTSIGASCVSTDTKEQSSRIANNNKKKSYTTEKILHKMNLYAGFDRSMFFKKLIISTAGLRIIKLNSLNALLFINIHYLVTKKMQKQG